MYHSDDAETRDQPGRPRCATLRPDPHDQPDTIDPFVIPKHSYAHPGQRRRLVTHAIHHPPLQTRAIRHYLRLTKHQIPNWRKIANDMWSLFCEEKAKIKSIIGDLRVSITTDTWTSIQNINYMVVTVHFIDSDFHLHKRVLNFCKITSHKGEDIGRCLEEKLVEWGISKVFTVTVDNASSNDVAVEYLKKQLRKHDSDSLMLDENLHMRCACHIINMIMKDEMKELVDSIEVIRNCVKYIHSSSPRLDKFREYAVLEKKDKMSTIPMDVVTRWNATYIMLHGAYKFKGVFARMVEEFTPFKTYFEDGRVWPQTDEDWEKAMGFAHFLQKFYDATIKLSATKTPTSHLVLKILINFKIEIEARIRNQKNIVLQNVATSMKKKFDKYWGSLEDMNILMFVAQTLDPRYMFQLMELQLGELGYTPNDVEHLKSRVKRHLYLMYEIYKGTEKSYVDVHEDVDDGVDLGDDDGDDDDDVEVRIERRLNKQRNEAKLKEIANEIESTIMMHMKVQRMMISTYWGGGKVKYQTTLFFPKLLRMYLLFLLQPLLVKMPLALEEGLWIRLELI
ncbi:Unknown protein [Striga hermonthica]|uniref:hAT-like transposase RNase-H fold domain-containing protein n=1 Tax=Striga hermonthica TaxID=68872 RepID=A0A9N7MTK8_STRHE|nr:Unknown protein [Striga hermonthica]